VEWIYFSPRAIRGPRVVTVSEDAPAILPPGMRVLTTGASIRTRSGFTLVGEIPAGPESSLFLKIQLLPAILPVGLRVLTTGASIRTRGGFTLVGKIPEGPLVVAVSEDVSFLTLSISAGTRLNRQKAWPYSIDFRWNNSSRASYPYDSRD
jgi:hypothetical protein